MMTRPIDPMDWCFFHELHPICEADRGAIRMLEEASACALWDELVSADPDQRHPMLLQEGHWISRWTALGPDWQEPWNDPEGTDTVAAFLRSRIDWPEDSDVCFLWMREWAVRMPWGVFLRTWRNCLFEYEGPFLIRKRHREFVFFGPNGHIALGYRVSSDEE